MKATLVLVSHLEAAHLATSTSQPVSLLSFGGCWNNPNIQIRNKKL